MKLLFRRPASMHIEVEQLSAYLDGHLALAERTRVEGHLQGCAACRGELESLRRTVALMQALPRVPVPRAFTLSEAQVGIRRREAQPAWRGSLLRGLGAATTLALVAVVAATVLRQPGSIPSASVARQAPSEIGVTPAAAMAPAPAEPQALSVETAVVEPTSEPMVAMAAPESTAAPEPPAAFAAPADARAAAPQPTAEAPSAKVAVPAATDTPEPAMLAMAPPAETEAAPEMAAAAMARGGGGGPVDGAIPPEALTPEALPQIKPANEILPAGVRLAYADLKGVWTIDRESGPRQLLRAEGANTPQIAPDGEQILYRTITETGFDLWAVRWDGSNARRTLSNRDLPKTGLERQYAERRIQDARWAPGQSLVAVTLSVVPAPAFPDAPYKTELWYLDLVSGKLRYVTDLGRSLGWPAFSPQGDRFAVLQYGTEADSQGTLTLYDADGSNGRVVLRFPASPAKVSYERQIAWTPDGQTLWLALPVADPAGPGQLNGTTLYRIPVEGDAEAVAQIDAYQVAWAPDTERLLFTRYTSDVMDTAELFLAGGDGADPHLYSTVKYGEFINWSPDGAHFVYQDSFQIYAGSPGAAPQRLGNGVSLFDLRWVSADQFISLHDTGSGWLLTLRGLDGSAAGLLPLPREAMVDINRP